MNEQQNGVYEIDEEQVKEVLVSMSQNKALELTQQNLLLQANYQVLLTECQNFPKVLDENKLMKEQIQEITEKSVEEVKAMLNEQTKIEASQEHAITDMQNMTNKIDTFYKPKIRELESEINELKKLLPEDTKIEKK
jgi:phosphoenolpyruvate carboxylase